jgi:ribosomal protein S18 acetylase RimI-like enzyme
VTEKIIPTIRRALAGDASLLATLGERTFFDTFARDNTAEDMAIYIAESFSPEIQAAELADPSITFFIAELKASAIGYAQLRGGVTPECVSGMKPIELARIYVTQDCLGRGVGEALLDTCIEEATRTGHETIWLGVWQKNARAERFYRNQNFRIVGEQAFQLGTDKQTDWIMQRAL